MIELRGAAVPGTIDAAGVKQRSGVTPSQIPDLIALRGDPSDGLPGARGIGAKTAAALLQEHGTLEAVIAAAPALRPRLAEALREQSEELRAFREIATLQDIPCPARPTTRRTTAAARRPPASWGWSGWPCGSRRWNNSPPIGLRNEGMVTTLRPIEVRTAAGDAVPKVAAALADAFTDDPVFTWLLPGRLRHQARLRTIFAAELEQYVLPNGTVWTTPGFDGALTELPPGAWNMANSVTLKEALKWIRVFGRRLALAMKVQRTLEERHMREPHFYVRAVGVRTALQGQGLGSALMRPTLERAELGRTAHIPRGQQRAQRGTV